MADGGKWFEQGKKLGAQLVDAWEKVKDRDIGAAVEGAVAVLAEGESFEAAQKAFADKILTAEEKANFAPKLIADKDLTGQRQAIDAKLAEVELHPGLSELLGLKPSLDHMFGATGAAGEAKPGLTEVAQIGLNPDGSEPLSQDTARALALLNFAAAQTGKSVADMIPAGENRDDLVQWLAASQNRGQAAIAQHADTIQTTVDRYALRTGLKALAASGVITLEGGAVDPSADTPLSSTEYTNLSKAIAAAKVIGGGTELTDTFANNGGQNGAIADLNEAQALAANIPDDIRTQAKITQKDLDAFFSAAAREQKREGNDFAAIAAAQTLSGTEIAMDSISDKIGQALEEWGVDTKTLGQIQEMLKGFFEAIMPIFEQVAEKLKGVFAGMQEHLKAGARAPAP
jgi:hypothetical protein